MQGSATTPDDLIVLLRRFQILTIYQITSLLQKQSSINNIRSKMKRLVDSGLVDFQFLPRTTPSGSTPMVYSLSSKGLKYVEEMGATIHAPQRIKKMLPLQHLLDINDVLIASLRLQSAAPEISVFEYRHEKVFKQNPIRITEGSYLCPDGFVHFVLSPPYGKPGEPMGIIWEVDCNTENADIVIREKVRRYRRLFHSNFEQVFGVPAICAAFVVTQGGETRVKQLVRAAEQELERFPDDSELFLFGSISPTDMQPLPFFTSALWLQPFQSSTVPLIERRF